MVSKLKRFISRFALLLGAALCVVTLGQFAVISIKNAQINALLQKNTELRAQLEDTEHKINDLVAIQSDIRLSQQEIESWLKGINKAPLSKFASYLNNSLEHQASFASLETNKSADFRLAKLELLAHKTRFDSSMLLNKTQAIRDFMVKIPSILPTQGYISSSFGTRIDPLTRKTKHHRGIDIAAPLGTPVRAPADGIVITAKHSVSFGRLIEIKHAHGFISRYGHLHELKVKKGERVAQGQLIGSTGNSGRSLGSHLHYEIEKAGQKLNPKDFLVVSSHDNLY